MGAPTLPRLDDLRIGILGPLEVRRADSVLALGGRQQRAVLALLVLERGRTVTVDRMADALWGDRPASGYVATIQTYVHHLRAVLEPDRTKGAPAETLVSAPGGGCPDLPKAKALVQQSGTTQVPITIHRLVGGGYEPFPAYIADVLRGLGYPVNIEDFPVGTANGDPTSPVYRGFQIFTHFGWIPDYPGPSSFFDFAGSCRVPNFNQFCDPQIEAVAKGGVRPRRERPQRGPREVDGGGPAPHRRRGIRDHRQPQESGHRVGTSGELPETTRRRAGHLAVVGAVAQRR